MKEFFRILWEYFIDRIIAIVVIILNYVSIFTVLSLANVKGQYISLLCQIISVIIIIAFIFDFYSYKSKRICLKKIENDIDLSVDKLPETICKLENDYHFIIDELNRIIKKEYDSNKRISDERNDYYTMWVHQIKTPIFAMRLILENNKDNESYPILTQQLFKIEQYCEMALQYIRLENISSDLKIDMINLEKIVKESVKKFSSVFINNHISIEIFDIDKVVITDKKWFSFVIEQLLSNSLKYTKKGGKIKIYTVNNNLVIEDNGIGIKKEDVERVFERGYTGYNGRLDNNATGIGLYLCRKICNALSHTIWIESEYSQGTKVFVDILESKQLEF